MRWIFLIFGNLLRNKVRTFLTIAGVAIGIYAMVVMGSLAEYLNNMVGAAKTYMGGVVHLTTKTNKEGENPGIPKETLKKIESLEEVESVSPFLVLLLDGLNLEKKPLSLFTPQFTVGAIKDLEILKSGRQGIEIIEGRWLKKGDDLHAIVNRRVVNKRGARLGEKLKIRNKMYKVVGIMKIPNIPAAPDAFVPYHRLNKDFQKPSTEFAEKVIRKKLESNNGGGLANLIDPAEVAKLIVDRLYDQYYPYYVLPKEGVNPNKVATEIRQIDPNVGVVPPKKLIGQVESAMKFFTLIMLCVGVISSVVAGLLIINTLVMSILERKKEIGIKMAIGASKTQIIIEFIGESALIGVVGGLIGIGLGVITILVANPWVISQVETGQALFLITPRLIIGAFFFALILSCLAGIYPAYRAAKLDPVETLRNL